MAGFTTTARWRRFRLGILERDNYRCRVRGPHCKGSATEVDHIIPVADGGPIYEPTNCRAACSWCNTWRSNRQKARDGWKRARTHITLLMGPPGSCDRLSAHLEEHAGAHDLIIDYRALARAIGDRPDEVRKLRGSLLTKLRRGETAAPRAWITSTNADAVSMFPAHDVVLIDPGRDYAMAHIHPGGGPLVEAWYRRHAEPALTGRREW